MRVILAAATLAIGIFGKGESLTHESPTFERATTTQRKSSGRYGKKNPTTTLSKPLKETRLMDPIKEMKVTEPTELANHSTEAKYTSQEQYDKYHTELMAYYTSEKYAEQKNMVETESQKVIEELHAIQADPQNALKKNIEMIQGLVEEFLAPSEEESTEADNEEVKAAKAELNNLFEEMYKKVAEMDQKEIDSIKENAGEMGKQMEDSLKNTMEKMNNPKSEIPTYEQVHDAELKAEEQAKQFAEHLNTMLEEAEKAEKEFKANLPEKINKLEEELNMDADEYKNYIVAELEKDLQELEKDLEEAKDLNEEDKNAYRDMFKQSIEAYKGKAEAEKTEDEKAEDEKAEELRKALIAAEIEYYEQYLKNDGKVQEEDDFDDINDREE